MGAQAESVNSEESTMDDGLLPIRRVAQILSVHPNTIRRWADAGILQCVRLGTRSDRKFRREDLEALTALESPLEPERLRVLQLVRRGRSPSQIAAILSLPTVTVQNDISVLCRRFGVTSRRGLIVGKRWATTDQRT